MIIFVIFTLVFNAYANWPHEMKTELNAKSMEAKEIQDSISATFWGGFKRYLHWSKNRGTILDLESKFFKSKKIKIYFSKADKKLDSLVVFMPGIYGQPTRGLTPHFIDLFESMGVSVLVVPNIFSPLYIESYPLYGENPTMTEIGVMNEALDYALKNLPQVKRVHVVAESLGAAIGAAWVGDDRENKKRIYDLTLLWPPRSLSRAMKNFDKVFKLYENSTCSVVRKLYVMSSEFLLNSFPNSLDKEDQVCVGEILLQDGFLKIMEKSFKTHLSSSGTESDFLPHNFETFFKGYRQELWKLINESDPKLDLSYWMKKIRQDKAFKVRMITSSNDFINHNEDWDQFKVDHSFSEENFILLNWGGHSGPMAIPEFQNYLKKALDL